MKAKAPKISNVVKFPKSGVKRIQGRAFNMTTIESAIQVCRERLGFELSLEQMVNLIESNDAFARDLRASGGATDTMTRELMIDAITMKLLGPKRHWPSNGDSEEVSKKFFEEFARAAKAAGYKSAEEKQNA